MGLTIHYHAVFKPSADDLAALQARWMTEEARNVAQKFKRKGLVDAVGPLRNDANTLKRFHWRLMAI